MHVLNYRQLQVVLTPLRYSFSLVTAYAFQSSPGFDTFQASLENMFLIRILHLRLPHTFLESDFLNGSYISSSSDHANLLQRSHLPL